MTNRKFLSFLLAIFMVLSIFTPLFAENDSVTVLPPRMAEEEEPQNIVIIEDDKDNIPIFDKSEEGGKEIEETSEELEIEEDNSPVILENREEGDKNNVVILPPIRNEEELEEEETKETSTGPDEPEKPKEEKENKKEVKVQILSKRDVKKPASEGAVNLVLLNDNPADINEEVYDEKIRWKESDFNMEEDKIISLSDEGLLKAKINKKLVIPEMENITIIEKEAFKGLSLRSVEIPKNIKEIKDEAFKDNQLKLVKILGKGKEISKNAFNEELVEEYEKCEDEEFLYEYGDKENELEIGEEIVGDAVGAVAPDDVSLYTFNGTTITGLSEKGKTYYNDNHDMVLPGKSPQGKVITKIGDRAFYNSWGSYRLTSVDFSNCTNLTGIGSEAFRNNELTSLDLSGCKSLSGIDYNAFLGNQLTNLNLSGCTNLKFIGGSAFNNNQLASLDLSGCTSLISIDGSAFDSNQLASLDLSGCTSLESIDSEAFNHNQITNLNLSGCVNLTSIGFWAFNQNQLTSLDLSGCINLTSIGRVAFGYSRLKTAKIPLSLKNLADDAFYRNPGNNDKKQVYLFTPDYTNPNNLKDTDYHLINPITGSDDVSLYTFSGTTITGLSEKGKIYYATNHDMVLPGKNPQGQAITAIGEDAFFKRDQGGVGYGLTSVDFSNCISLTSIGDSAFMNNQLTSLDLSGLTSLTSIDGTAFQQNQLTSLDLSGCINLAKIGQSAFSGNQLTSLNLSGCTSLTSISGTAFIYNKLTNLNLSGLTSLTSIDGRAFAGNQLTSLNLSGCTNLTSIGAATFAGNQITNLDLSECTSLASIGFAAFATNKLKTVKIPLSLKTLAENAFGKNLGNNAKKQVYLYTPDYTNPNNLKDTDYHLINPVESSDDVTLYTFNGTTITGLSERGKKYFTEHHEMVLPGKNPQGQPITAIGKRAFNNNTNGYGLTSVDFSNCTSLTSIGQAAFGHNNLTSLDLSECRNLREISIGAFNSNKLTSLDLSECRNLESIGDEAFLNNQLTSLNLSGCVTLTSIERGAFVMNNLTNLDLSGCTSLISIGAAAFSRNQLKIAKIPLSLKTIVSTAFSDNQGNNDKKQVYLYTPDYTNPNNLLDTDYHLINPITDSDDGTLYTFEGTVITGLSERGKKYFETHHEMKLPKSNPTGSNITAIGEEAFYNSGNGYGITNVDFSNCSSLKNIGNYAFYNNNIQNLDLSNNLELTTIGEAAFRKNQLTSLDLSKNTIIKNINLGAFSDNKINSINLSNCTNLDSIAPFAFKNNNIEELDLSTCSALTNIGSQAFADNNIKTSDIPLNLKKIGFTAFKNNPGNNEEKQVYLYTYNHANPNNLKDTDYHLINPIAGPDDVSLYEFSPDGEGLLGLTPKGIEYYKNHTHMVLPGISPEGVSVKYIDENAFSKEENIERLYYDDACVIKTLDLTNMKELTHIGGGVFFQNGIESVDFTGLTKLKIIDNEAFMRNNVTELDLSSLESLEELGHFVFGQNKLKTLNLNGLKNLKAIYDLAFGINKIENLDLSSCTSLKKIDLQAFFNNKLNTVNIPLSVEEIGVDAFQFNPGNNTEKQVYLYTPDRTNPHNIKDTNTYLINPETRPDAFNLYTFEGTTITGLTEEGKKYYTDNHDMILPGRNPQGELITAIGKNAFYNQALKTVDFSKISSLTEIGTGAFNNNQIETLNSSNLTKIEKIGNSAFSNNALKELDLISTNVKEIDGSAFNGNNLKTGLIPLSLELIKESEGSVFGDNPGSNGYTQVYLYTPDYTNPHNLEDGRSYLINPVLGSDDVTLYTFDGKTITGLSERGKEYFKESHEMVLPGKTPDGQDVTAIGEHAFYNNGDGYGLTKVDLNSLKELDGIGRNAFSNNKIETVNLYDCPNLLFIWDEAFSNNQLKTFITPQSLTRLEDDVFKGNIGNNDKKQVFVYTPTRKNPKGFLSNEWQIIDPIKITIKKVDAKGNPIEGVEFSVRYGPYENVSETPNSLKNSNELELNKISTDGLMVSDEKLDIVRVMDSGGGWSSGSGSGFIKPGDIKLKATTDKNGTAEITIPYGPYYLVEDKTVPGYSVNKKVTIIDETLDGKTITYTDYEVSIEVPETGTLGTLPYILLALLLVGGAYVVLRKKKEEEK